MDCTVLTIAHRLSSIIDSDLVMVMDNGNLVVILSYLLFIILSDLCIHVLYDF